MDGPGRRLYHARVDMVRETALVIASVALLGCGGRSTLDTAGGCFTAGCDPPRVADCERRTPEATPLAILRVNNVRFTADEDALYFPSGGRIHRLPRASGKAVALTPEPAGGAGSSIRSFDAGDGVLAWLDGSTLRAMPVGGGDVRTLAELPDDQVLAVVAPGYVVTTGYEDPLPVYRVPIAGGPPEVLVPSARVVGTARDDATGEVLLATRDGLFAVDASTGAITKLSSEVDPVDPAAAGGAVFDVGYAVDVPLGLHSGFDGIFRVMPGQQSQQIARGRFISIAADADDVVFDGAVGDPVPGQASIGFLPHDGGPPVLLATSDSFFGTGGDLWQSYATTVRTDGTYVYFAQVCLDTVNTLQREFRLVRLPKHAAE
jgi:hypothetical protein